MIDVTKIKIFIMIGVPGSGKSTRANNLAKPNGIIHSTDDVISTYGDYSEIFNRMNSTGNFELLFQAHNENLKNFKKSVLSGISPIIVDNTNLSIKDIKPYITFAVDNGVKVENIELVKIGTGGLSAEQLALRNTHNVPLKTIKSMIDKYTNLKNITIQEIINSSKTKKVLYSGVILSEDSRERLLSELNILISKLSDWKVIAHHCTITLGELEDKTLLGKQVYMLVTHIGKSDNALAVMVSGVDTKNKIPHITVAISPNGKPKDSNDITNWMEIKRFGLSGVVEEVTN